MKTQSGGQVILGGLGGGKNTSLQYEINADTMIKKPTHQYETQMQ